MKDEKDITTKEAASLPAFNFQADIGAGMEGTDKEAFAIPFLRVIQSGSPQVKKGKPEFNPDAREGMLVNTVTGELFDGEKGLIIVPCAYQRRYIRWGGKGQPDEGKFKGEYLPEAVDEMIKTGQIVEADGALSFEGDDINDTRSHYILALTENGPQQMILALSSTMIKKSKQLMSILSSVKIKVNGQLVTPPTWLNQIKLTTAPDSNDQGQWATVKFEAAGFVQDEQVYNAGKAFHDTVLSGAAKAAYGSTDEGTDGKSKF